MTTNVYPFKGLLYDNRKIDFSDVIAPPYDIITPEKQSELYERSEHNIVRVDFGKSYPDDNEETNKYTRASETLQGWIENGIVTFSEKPAFYLYESRYNLGTTSIVMKGVFGAVKLEELGNGIYPHEETRSKPKADRLNLMYSCKANLSPVFSLYNKPENAISEIMERISKSKPYIDCTDDEGLKHRCWIIDDKKDIDSIIEDLRGVDIFIADGHHRYETAMEFQRQQNEGDKKSKTAANYDNVLMLLVNIADKGVSIFPTHRLLKELPDEPIDVLRDYFDVEHHKGDKDIMKKINGHRHTYGIYLADREGFYTAKYKGNGADDISSELKDVGVTILHELIFKKLYNVESFEYEMSPDKTIEKVDNGEFKAAFFLNATGIEDIEKSAKLKKRLPAKSTYFYPKIPTGLVINCF